MEGEIPQENPKSIPTSATLLTDHRTLPLQGEVSMRNGDNDGGKNPLMDAVKLEIEMEKKKIREQIIEADFHRRKQLEAEVRMELMKEIQIMGTRRLYRDFSVVDDPYKRMLMNSGFLGYQGATLFHKKMLNVGSSEGDFGERLKLINTSVDGIDDLLQINSDPCNSNVFGDRAVDTGSPAFQRNSNSVTAQIAGKFMGEFGGDEVCGQAMSSSGISGMKRKAEISSPTDEEIASVARTELWKKKWYCSLCEVSATSAGGLNLHVNGKKHKTKEAWSKSCEIASTISIYSYSIDNSMHPVEQTKAHMQSMEEHKTQVQPMEEDKKQVQLVKKEKTQVIKKLGCSLCQIFASSEILLRSHLQGKKHKAKEAKLGISQVTSEANVKSEVNKWFCSLCKVFAASEKNLNDHFQGKKHKAKAGLLSQEADSVDSNPVEKISKDKVVANEPATVNTSTSEFNGTSNNEGKKQETSYKETVENEESEEIDQEELVKVWVCKTCNEETNDEATMTNHRKSSKHMSKLREDGGALIVVSSMMKETVKGEKDAL